MIILHTLARKGKRQRNRTATGLNSVAFPNANCYDAPVYEIEFSTSALQDLASLRKFDQKAVLESLETQLRHQPTVETRNRKRLRPNDFAQWELRVGRFRVFYNGDDEALIVRIEAIGVKQRNLLFVRGERRVL